MAFINLFLMSLNKLEQHRVIASLIDSTEKHISDEGMNLKRLLEKKIS